MISLCQIPVNPSTDMTDVPSRPEFWWRWRQKRWFRWFSDIAFFVVVFGAISYFQTSHHVESGVEAPLFSLTTLDGETINSADLRGKPAVLFFWAPWCSVCKADAHNISALREAVGDETNIVSIALSYESIEDVKKFVDENDVTGPVLLGHRATSDAFKVDSFPTVYILDQDGEVASSVVGYTTEIGLRARLLTHGVY